MTESLRERLPDVYDKEEIYVIEWRIFNALAQGRHEIIPSFTNDLARLAGMDIDRWSSVEDQLAYHGHLTTLVEAMRLAWPQIRTSADVLPWGIDEFSYGAVQYEILNYIAQTPSPDGNDPVLHERIEHFYGNDYFKDRIAHYTDILTGRADHQWTMDDFNLPPPEEESDNDWDDDGDWDEDEAGEDGWDDEDDDDDEERNVEDEEESEDEDEGGKRPVKTPHPAEANLADLTIQFVRYAHNVEGASYSKAELARHEMLTFIRRRHRGGLEYVRGASLQGGDAVGIGACLVTLSAIAGID